MVKKFSLETYKDIYSKVPRLTVELLIKNSEGVLLTQRKTPPGLGLWYLPGATVLMDETVEQALKRCARDELGVEISINKLVDVIDWFGTKNSIGHPISLVYEVEVISGELNSKENLEPAKFFRELPKEMMAEHRNFLQFKLK